MHVMDSAEQWLNHVSPPGSRLVLGLGNIGLGRTLPSTLGQLCQCRHGVSAKIQFIVDRLRSRSDYAASTRKSLSARALSVAGRAR